MKRCCRCKKEKDNSEFFKRPERKSGLRSECKECSYHYMHKYRNEHRKYFNEFSRRYQKMYAKQNEEFIIEYLSQHPCVDCGNDDINILEFDHIRGIKKDRVGAMKYHAALETLKEEIAKCEVRCPNCHRIRTLKELGVYVSYSGIGMGK
jgi:DNA-directed RNA polymerase subunit RPC12/RpoP